VARVTRDKIPVFIPDLPSADSLICYLRMIDDNRIYSNNGPLNQLLVSRYSIIFSTPSEKMVLSSNGTAALTQILSSHNVANKSDHVICPSFTFPATASSIVAAGGSPLFVDVDMESLGVTPEILKKALKFASSQEIIVKAAIVVAPFGGSVDFGEWIDFQSETGIPVVIDAAGSFHAMAQTMSEHEGDLNLDLMISLHATKPFGIGEGAIVIARDKVTAETIRMWGNFGFNGERRSIVPGVNSKLSEYSAAVGLAVIDEIDNQIERYQTAREKLFDNVNLPLNIKFVFRESDSKFVTGYSMIRLKDMDVLQFMDHLQSHGIDSRKWWDGGCHDQIGFQSRILQYPHDWFTNTQRLVGELCGIPFYSAINSSQLVRISKSINSYKQKR
jgi:dTDP-4-amino-4,6-dideoxygalactose transaminase